MALVNLTTASLPGSSTASSAANPKAVSDSLIGKSAREFESLLLSSWLQDAYQSFGAVPDSDESDDLDAGREQFQGLAMQSLGSAMTAEGGIGIARIVADSLRKSAAQQTLQSTELPQQLPPPAVTAIQDTRHD